MKRVEPEVFLIARPAVDYDEMSRYLKAVSGQAWLSRSEDGDREPVGPRATADLLEFAGRLCYRSWEPGLNPNVRRVRANQDDYLRNLLKQAHGSVLEHANFTFVLHNVSRVLTHELVRHRAGTAVSQESMRFVRLTELPFPFPEWAEGDEELMARSAEFLEESERFQQWLSEHFDLDSDDRDFGYRKHRTSFMRRFAPDGVATGLVWTANVRAIRHVLEARTAPGAEEEIRLVFDKVGRVMRAEAPALFGDFEVRDGAWVPGWSKV